METDDFTQEACKVKAGVAVLAILFMSGGSVETRKLLFRFFSIK